MIQRYTLSTTARSFNKVIKIEAFLLESAITIMIRLFATVPIAQMTRKAIAQEGNGPQPGVPDSVCVLLRMNEQSIVVMQSTTFKVDIDIMSCHKFSGLSARSG